MLWHYGKVWVLLGLDLGLIGCGPGLLKYGFLDHGLGLMVLDYWDWSFGLLECGLHGCGLLVSVGCSGFGLFSPWVAGLLGLLFSLVLRMVGVYMGSHYYYETLFSSWGIRIGLGLWN